MLTLPSMYLAQEETPEPEPVVTIFTPIEEPVDMSPDPMVNAIINAIIGVIVTVPSFAGFVTVATSLTKRVISTWKSERIAFGWGIILWGAYMLVLNTNLVPDPEKYIEGFVEMGYVLLALTGTQVASGWWYDKNRQAKTPFVGFSRTEETLE